MPRRLARARGRRGRRSHRPHARDLLRRLAGTSLRITSERLVARVLLWYGLLSLSLMLGGLAVYGWQGHPQARELVRVLHNREAGRAIDVFTSVADVRRAVAQRPPDPLAITVLGLLCLLAIPPGRRRRRGRQLLVRGRSRLRHHRRRPARHAGPQLRVRRRRLIAQPRPARIGRQRARRRGYLARLVGLLVIVAIGWVDWQVGRWPDVGG